MVDVYDIHMFAINVLLYSGCHVSESAGGLGISCCYIGLSSFVLASVKFRKRITSLPAAKIHIVP